MEQAYDLKVLGERLKGVGIEGGEETAKAGLKVIFGWLKESAVISKMPYDDMGLVILPKLEEMAIGAAEKINPAD